jgi:hypothetical protein
VRSGIRRHAVVPLTVPVIKASVEQSGGRYANEAGLSDSDRAEMAELMNTLMDRAFGIFTAVDDGPNAAAAAEDGYTLGMSRLHPSDECRMQLSRER